jgi:hypothetical protein
MQTFFCILFVKILFFFPSIKILWQNSWNLKKYTNFAVPINNGVVAQLVEQRTENPCVTGSIPVDTTQRDLRTERNFSPFFILHFFFC